MNKYQTWWAEVRSSLWLLPTLLTLSSIGLAFLTLGLDRTTLAGLPASRLWWLFGGGAAGARGVLSAIASGIITVTGVVFSITIVVWSIPKRPRRMARNSCRRSARDRRTRVTKCTERGWSPLVIVQMWGSWTSATPGTARSSARTSSTSMCPDARSIRTATRFRRSRHPG